MRRAKYLYDDVRSAQKLLGTGDVEEAIAAARPLLVEARELVADPRITSFERDLAKASVVYSTVTLILGIAEARPAKESVPDVRELAAAAVASHRPGAETWKALGAAAEMLARAGDAYGASWAVKKAVALGASDDYMVQLQGSIRSMYPQVFKEIPEDPEDVPPPLPDQP